MHRTTASARGARRFGRLALVFGAAVVLASGCDWAQFHYGPAHTGFNPSEPSLNIDNVSLLTERWTGATGDSVSSSPAVVNGIVYLTTEHGHLYAFDATGNGCTADEPQVCDPLWSAAVGTETFASPVVADGRVYAGSSNGDLYVFDAAGIEGCSGTPKTCDPLWIYPTDEPGVGASTATIANGLLYLGGGATDALFVFSADGTTGCEGTPKVCHALWYAQTEGVIEAAPTVADGYVFVGSNDHNLYAFDAMGATNCNAGTCRPVWVGATAGAIRTTPAAAGGHVFVGSDDGNLYAFATHLGPTCSGLRVCLPLWRAGTTGPVLSSPAVAYGHVYLAANDVLNVYDAAGITNCTGAPGLCEPLWTSQVGSPEPTSSPSIAGGLVFIGTEDFRSQAVGVAAFDAQGVRNCFGGFCPPLWQSSSPSDTLRGAPAVVNGWVYAIDNSGVLHAFAFPSP